MWKKLMIQSDKERGQSFTELAISLVFLLMLLSAAVDLGWAFYTLITLRDTAQETASFGAICTNTSMVRERFNRSTSAPIDAAQISGVNICYSNPATPSLCKTITSSIAMGDNIRVTVNYEHRIVTPFVGAIINRQSYPLTVTVSDTVLQVNQSIACK